MRIGLRWKIILLTLLTPLTLGLATLFTVHRNVNEHVHSSSIHESLEHSVSVFESMLQTRSRALGGGARVIAQDPRFFSLLMLGAGQRDHRFVATVKGMAADFNRITQTDMFEVVDRRGRLLASVGTMTSTKAARDSLVGEALRGQMVEGILIEPKSHFQVAVTPVRADGEIVGALLLGAEIGPALANELRAEMRCEVTFLSGATVTGTTITAARDRAALLHTLSDLDLGPTADLKRLGVLRVNGAKSVFLTLVRRLPGAAPARRQLYVMQRSFDPEASFQHIMQQDMQLLAAVALLIALFTGLLFSETILRPLQKLVRGAREMEAGNYNSPLDVRRGDEIGYLAERFVEMRRRERAYVESLEQAARLKSEFISIASHELRTPISVLAGYRDLLAEEALGPITPKQKDALETMSGYLARLTRVAEDATQVAQVRGERLALDFQPCIVEPLVRRAVGAALAVGANRSVQIDVRCDAIDGPVEADGDGLGQAVTQLVMNGIRFTPDGGRVDVWAHATDRILRIEVKDSGVGIPEGKLRALFEHGLPVRDSDHHQTASGLEFNSSGLGLGLSFARSIVEAHGGTLTAESEAGVGSTFVMSLPRTQERNLSEAA